MQLSLSRLEQTTPANHNKILDKFDCKMNVEGSFGFWYTQYKSVSQQTPFSLPGLALNTLKFNDFCPSVPSKRFLTWSGEGEVVLLSHIMFFLEMMPIL